MENSLREFGAFRHRQYLLSPRHVRRLAVHYAPCGTTEAVEVGSRRLDAGVVLVMVVLVIVAKQEVELL